MVKLFTEYPVLENDTILLRKIKEDDAEALGELIKNELVYRYLPTFLFERSYEDPLEFIRRMDRDLFETKGSIYLAVCLKSDPGWMVGIAEIYNYEPKKEKASIGCRLDSSVWGQGIATQVIGLLKEYLIEEAGLRTITAHIIRENGASARAAVKNGFVLKYPDIYGDWGQPELCLVDKYVFKREWMENGSGLKPVHVEQFVMAYEAEQDRIRAMLPKGYGSLRPVLRINTEIRDEQVVYAEFNTPVSANGRKGWLNIANWKSSSGDDLQFTREAGTVKIRAPFLSLSYTFTGMSGGCPAEKDNEGCYYIGLETEFRPAEKIEENKEFVDCSFEWRFREGDAAGRSMGKTLPAVFQPEAHQYEPCALTAENAARIPCRQVLGAYVVRFERYAEVETAEDPAKTV